MLSLLQEGLPKWKHFKSLLCENVQVALQGWLLRPLVGRPINCCPGGCLNIKSLNPHKCTETSLCLNCKLFQDQMFWATIEHKIPFGVWGGMGFGVWEIRLTIQSRYYDQDRSSCLIFLLADNRPKGYFLSYTFQQLWKFDELKYTDINCEVASATDVNK